MTLRAAALLVAAATAVAASGTRARAGDDLLYYVDGQGSIVFTNTPSRKDVKPVPRLAAGRVSRTATLPATRFDPYIDMVARDNGLDPTLVKAVALVESGFNPKAVSRKGARGLMQLMPKTAARYGVSDPTDPYQSLRGGARHLRDLLDAYDGNVTLALAAYNAGQGAVARYGGVPAFAETRDYVRKVQAKMGRTRHARRARPVASKAPPIRMSVEPDGSITLTN